MVMTIPLRISVAFSNMVVCVSPRVFDSRARPARGLSEPLRNVLATGGFD